MAARALHDRGGPSQHLREAAHGGTAVSLALVSCVAVSACRTPQTAGRRYAFCPTAKYNNMPTTGSSSTIKAQSSFPVPDIELTRNWLRVFGNAEASRMGHGVGQQRHTRAVRSEKWWDSVAA